MRIRYAGCLWDVDLVDDGTLDTHVQVESVRNPTPEGRGSATFSQEYASQYRRKDGLMTGKGLRALAIEVIEGMNQ